MFFPSHRKTLALLICLAYLFIGAGGARAFIWCYQADGGSHADFSPSGSCESPCEDSAPSVADVAGGTLQGEHQGEDCRDVPVFLAQAKKVRAFEAEVLATGIAIAPPPQVIPHFSATQKQLLLSPKPPPPSPMLAALRTVVLLN